MMLKKTKKKFLDGKMLGLPGSNNKHFLIAEGIASPLREE
jgi:hypothetical protein